MDISKLEISTIDSEDLGVAVGVGCFIEGLSMFHTLRTPDVSFFIDIMAVPLVRCFTLSFKCVSFFVMFKMHAVAL